MAAQTVAAVFHGVAPGTPIDVTNQTLRMKRSDDDTQDALSPVPIPSSGFEYSWRKSFKLFFTTAPDNAVSNLRFFSDGGSLGVGRSLLFGRSSSYVQASAADQSGGIGSTDVSQITAASPEVIQAGDVVISTDSFPTDGNQDFVMLQLRNDSTAIAGDASAEVTCSYRYDET